MVEKPTVVKRFSLGCKIFEQFGDTAEHSPGLFIPGVIRLSFITDALSFPSPLLKLSLRFPCLYSGLMPVVLLYQPPFPAFTLILQDFCFPVCFGLFAHSSVPCHIGDANFSLPRNTKFSELAKPRLFQLESNALFWLEQIRLSILLKRLRY